jgi:hypothetical protein
MIYILCSFPTERNSPRRGEGNQHVKVLALIVFLIFSLDGCSPKIIDIDPAMIDAEESNNVIILSAPDGCNDYKINAPVCLSVELISEDSVIFRTDSVGIYEFVEGNWVTVTDVMDGPSNTYIIIPSDVAYYRSATFSVQPVVGNRNEPVTLRFIAIGNLYFNEEIGDPVMAFADVTFFP